MNLKMILAASSVLVIAAAGVVSAEPGKGKGKAIGQQGLSSIGATAGTPGKWFQELKEHPWYRDLDVVNPATMAKKEHTDGAGAGQTPTVGAFIDYFRVAD